MLLSRAALAAETAGEGQEVGRDSQSNKERGEKEKGEQPGAYIYMGP